MAISVNVYSRLRGLTVAKSKTQLKEIIQMNQSLSLSLTDQKGRAITMERAMKELPE